VDDIAPIEESKRYVFGETDSFYGVWDRQAGMQLVGQFPLTDQGFERAADRYTELKRRDRAGRGLLLSALWWVILLGVSMMVVGGVLEMLGLAFDFEFLVVTNFAFSLSSIGYNVTIGGLALLIGRSVIRREVRTQENEASRPLLTAGVGILWWAMIGGIVIWLLSTVATHVVFQYRGPPFIGAGPDTGAVVAATIEALAFRVWVGALAIIWARWLLSPRVAGRPEAAG
jgi:hypothetical protein